MSESVEKNGLDYQHVTLGVFAAKTCGNCPIGLIGLRNNLNLLRLEAD